MKLWVVTLLVSQLFAPAQTDTASTNPLQKSMDLLSALQQQIIGEGEKAQNIYDKFAGWCEDRSKKIRYSIKDFQAEVEDLKAGIEKAQDEADALGTKIEELSTAISADEADLKAATLIREKEATDFNKVQNDLVSTIDMLERAIAILEKNAKGGVSMMQMQGVPALSQALTVMVDAGGISTDDTARLTALVQSANSNRESDGEGDEDSDTGAPDPAAYKSQSGGIVDTMQGLLDKAETQLDDTRQTETTRQGNFEVLKQSLEDKLAVAGREMDAAKKAAAEQGEKQASKQGDVSVTQKTMAEEKANLAELHHNCMNKAGDFEEEMKARGEELKALAEAKKVLNEMTGGAEKQTYSFLQEGTEEDSTASAGIQAVRMVKRLAKRSHSHILVQLASRLDATVRSSETSGDDPFAKVKDLISEMIGRLSDEADAEAQHKLWCDKAMGETTRKKTEKESSIEKLTTQIDQLTAGSAKLSEEVATLQKELADLAEAASQMKKIRQEETDLFKNNKPEMENGIKGVKAAVNALRDYYSGGDKGSSGGRSIIGLLEVVESDFAKGLSELIAEEEAATKSYEKEMKENEIARTTKEQDVKYKSKEMKAWTKQGTELSADRDSLQAELDAVNEYFARLKEQCIAKAEPYEERKKRRDREIAGLQEALKTLEGPGGEGGGSSFFQKISIHQALRGHVAA